MNFIWVALGGSFGATLRYLLVITVLDLKPGTPPFLGTILSNLLGCLILGFFIPFLPKVSDFSRCFFLIGFLGSLTTLSSISLEAIQLMSESKFLLASYYWLSNTVLGLGASLLGLYVSNNIIFKIFNGVIK